MKSIILRCIKETDPENWKIERRWVARLTDIFRDATKVKEINALDKISTISDSTTLTVNTDTSESSSSSNRSNTETKRDGALGKKIHLPPQPIEEGIALGDQSPKVRDTLLDPIPLNEQAAEERKPQNSSEYQEAIEKGKTPGDQYQKEKIDAPLYPIPPAGQAVEEIKPLNTSEEQEPIGKEKTPGDQGQKENFDAPL